MEELKSKSFPLIEDYAAMDPSLEQVFLSFAREAQREKEFHQTEYLHSTPL